MAPPSLRAVLIAPSRASQRVTPRFLSAALSAVDLTTVAAAADDHLAATGRAQEQPGGCGFTLMGGAQNRWTNATIAGILTLHACPARCGHGAEFKPPSSDRRRACPLSRASFYPATPTSVSQTSFAIEAMSTQPVVLRWLSALHRSRQIYADSDRHLQPQCQ